MNNFKSLKDNMTTNTNSKQYALVIDTATDELSVAVVADGRDVIAHHQHTVWRDMAARLQPTILEALAEAGIGFQDLNAIYTNLGPGSFTSIRIGLAAVKALSFALAIPAYGASGMAAHVQPYITKAARGQTVAVCLKAVGRDVYWQVFAPDGQPQAETQSLPLAQAMAECPGRGVLLSNVEATDNPDAGWPEGLNIVPIKAPNPLDVMATARGSGHSGDLKPIYVRPLTYKKQIA